VDARSILLSLFMSLFTHSFFDFVGL